MPPPFTAGMHIPDPATVVLPFTSACRKEGDGKHVRIHFEHVLGSSEFTVPIEFAKGLINQLQEVTGGIVVASPNGG